MADGESIESIVRRVRALERDELAEIGQLPAPVATHWRRITNTKMVITGERRDHMLDGHPEMADHMPALVETLTDPQAIFRDKVSDTTATFWRALDDGSGYWIRASVSLAITTQGSPANSLITAWRIRPRGYAAEVRSGRLVWEKWRKA